MTFPSLTLGKKVWKGIEIDYGEKIKLTQVVEKNGKKVSESCVLNVMKL